MKARLTGILAAFSILAAYGRAYRSFVQTPHLSCKGAVAQYHSCPEYAVGLDQDDDSTAYCAVKLFFTPANWVDRKLRPKLWSDHYDP